MYLHLGSSIAVPIKDIIGIFDIDNATTEKTTRAYLKSAEEEGMVITVGDDLPKSLVVCCPKGSWQRVYISPWPRLPLWAVWKPTVYTDWRSKINA